MAEVVAEAAEINMESPYKVPPFNPPPNGCVTYIWWSWHPRYPYWSQSCWEAASIEEAQEWLVDPRTKLKYYHNKLIEHNSITLVEVQDEPCKEMEIWWDIFNQDKSNGII